MLWSRDGQFWELSCSECFARLGDVTGARNEVVVFVAAENLELRPGDVLWCIDCQRKFREVKTRFRRRRRR